MADEKKSEQPNANMSEQQQSEMEKQQSSENKLLTKEALKSQMVAEFNLLLSKIQLANLGDTREIRNSVDRMEESYLWFQCAVDKFQGPDA